MLCNSDSTPNLNCVEALERCSQIEKEAGREIVKVLAEAQAAFLENLVPEQRIKAKALIGQPFHYRPDDFTTYLQLEEK